MIYMFLADGFEEAEVICPLDILRRCGIDVKTVSVTKKLAVCGAHGISLNADTVIDEIIDNAQMYVLPGGTVGVENLSNCEKLCDILKSTNSQIAAICAAPTLLAKLGILKNKKAVCYPSLVDELCGAEVGDEHVVVDGRIVTSMGPGTAFEFGFALASRFADEAVVSGVKAGMLLN